MTTEARMNETMLVPGKVKQLPYQFDIVETITRMFDSKGRLHPDFFKNYGVVLPTSLGKTYIAMQIVDCFYPHGMVLMLAPTLALLRQHYELFRECFVVPDEIRLIVGMQPSKRQLIWDGGICLATPQTVANDIAKGIMDLDKVSLMIFDECHLAVGDHAYVRIAKAAREHHCHLLGLTASPGDSSHKINQVAENLGIAQWLNKTEKDADVRQFVKAKDNIPTFEKMPLPMIAMEEMVTDQLLLLNRYFIEQGFGIIDQDGRQIEEPDHDYQPLGFYGQVKTKIRKPCVCPDKVMSLADLEALQALMESLVKDRALKGRLQTKCGEYYKWRYFLQVLVSEGYEVAMNYLISQELKSVPQRKINKKTKQSLTIMPSVATKNMVGDSLFGWLKTYLEIIGRRGDIHPKIEALVRILKHNWRPGVAALVFANSVSCVRQLERAINSGGHPFSGQARMITGQSAMKKGEQLAALAEFSSGRCSIFLSTTVLELGMHLPAVKLVINYNAPMTAISKIQRAGRTGRVAPGDIFHILMKHPIDTAVYYSSRRKETRMQEVLENAG
ncbi:MAG: helicase-related protein [Patescibacteria group bacterium]